MVVFAIELENSVLNLPNGQLSFLGEFKLQKTCNQSCSTNFFRRVEMTFRLTEVHASYNLPEWQAVN